MNEALSKEDIVTRLRENADLDAMEHCNPIVIAMEREAADEIERLREALAALSNVEQEPLAYAYGTGLLWADDMSEEDKKEAIPLYTSPIASGKDAWISVEERLPEPRKCVLVAVSWVRYGEDDDGKPFETTGVDVTEGEFVPTENGGYMDSFQGQHGDTQYITHWMPLPQPPEKKGGSK